MLLSRQSSLREAQELAQCAGQLWGSRPEIQTQIHLPRAVAINPRVSFSSLHLSGWLWAGPRP